MFKTPVQIEQQLLQSARCGKTFIERHQHFKRLRCQKIKRVEYFFCVVKENFWLNKKGRKNVSNNVIRYSTGRRRDFATIHSFFCCCLFWGYKKINSIRLISALFRVFVYIYILCSNNGRSKTCLLNLKKRRK